MLKLQEMLNEMYNLSKEENPIPFEKWGRGRPSKAKLEMRRLYWEKEDELNKKYPERRPFINAILNDNANMLNKGEFIYQPRC